MKMMMPWRRRQPRPDEPSCLSSAPCWNETRTTAVHSAKKDGGKKSNNKNQCVRECIYVLLSYTPDSKRARTRTNGLLSNGDDEGVNQNKTKLQVKANEARKKLRKGNEKKWAKKRVRSLFHISVHLIQFINSSRARSYSGSAYI